MNYVYFWWNGIGTYGVCNWRFITMYALWKENCLTLYWEHRTRPDIDDWQGCAEQWWAEREKLA